MFKRRFTLKKLLATTLSVCLLGMFLGCMTVCAERMEDSVTVDTPVLSRSCADGGCLVQASVTITLPERSFFSAGCDDGVIQYLPAFRSELISGGSKLRFRFLSTLDPPFKRLCVLRI